MAKAGKEKSKASSSTRTRKNLNGPDPIDVHVGSRVRLRRMILSMSQEKLGKALGLTFQQVQKYEKGVNRIGASRLMHLAELLEVPVQFFYDDFGGAKNASASGLADDGAAFMDFVKTPEGVQLCRHFSSIEDPKVRKRVLDLVKTISETEGQ
ncbi:MAG: transcriptional regulator [Hyphococcus sp.]|nr:MAG: transcriptional regulator [Marinicaulis sp.]